MNGTLDREASWEKQTIWKLDNGFTATVEYSQFYGEFITRLDYPAGLLCKTGKPYWHCSDGSTETLPDFAAAWAKPYHSLSDKKLVFVGFNRIWPDDPSPTSVQPKV